MTPETQTNIYDINILHQELNKGVHIAEILEGKINR